MNVHDKITERSTDQSGITQVKTVVKPKSWIRRLRGERDHRMFYAWREEGDGSHTRPGMKGRGDPLPCLR